MEFAEYSKCKNVLCISWCLWMSTVHKNTENLNIWGHFFSLYHLIQYRHPIVQNVDFFFKTHNNLQILDPIKIIHEQILFLFPLDDVNQHANSISYSTKVIQSYLWQICNSFSKSDESCILYYQKNNMLHRWSLHYTVLEDELIVSENKAFF